MEDITPLNLEDSPKLFGMRFDQLIWIICSFLAATQLYSWMNEVTFGGHNIKLYICMFVFFVGPAYALITMNQSANAWETILNFYVGSSVFIPGPDPNPVRFLVDEKLPEFTE